MSEVQLSSAATSDAVIVDGHTTGLMQDHVCMSILVKGQLNGGERSSTGHVVFYKGDEINEEVMQMFWKADLFQW